MTSEERPFFCGRAEDNGKVPDLPFAIIVPVSLVAQWVNELKSFIGDNKLEIYVFPTAALDWPKFFAPSSAWSRSSQPLYLRVIIFQHSVRPLLTSRPTTLTHAPQTIANMAGQVLFIAPKSNPGLATSDPRRRRGPYVAASKKWCPWEMLKFLGTFIDEAHIGRTTGRTFHGFMEMMRASHVRILATATPLQHTPKASFDLSFR